MLNVRRRDDRTRRNKLNIKKKPNMFVMITERNILHAEKKKKKERRKRSKREHTAEYRKKNIIQDNLV